MKQALLLAQKALSLNEVPVGALIVDPKDNIIGQAWNLREQQQMATQHAEILAIEQACRHLNSWRLEGCRLYVTLEPCPMCAGAIWASRLEHVIFGAIDPKSGFCQSLYEMGKHPKLNHRFESLGGVLEKECSEILKNFFKGLRQK